MVVSLFLNEQHVVTFDADPRWLEFVGRQRVCAQAWYDMATAVVWARLIPEGATEYVTHMADAEGQPPYYYGSVPGSLLSRFEDTVPEFFPELLLEREFFLHVDYLRRYLK